MPDQQGDTIPGGTGFQPVQTEQITRRNLPHIQLPGLTYHVVYRTDKHFQLNHESRRIALDACLFWNGSKCVVHACIVMPDHVHLLLTPCQIPNTSSFYSLSELLHSIKRHSANLINKLTKRTGKLWQDESYDRYIRSDPDFEEKYLYIAYNAVKDGLAASPGEYPYLFLQWPNHV